MVAGITPIFRITADGVDVTAPINDRLVKLDVVDHEGMQADTVSITVDDRDFAVKPPRKGAILAVAMGYLETGLADMGLFTVTGRKRHFKKGAGRVLEITGRSADMRREMKRPRTGEYKDTDLQGIVGKVAGRYGLGAKVSAQLGKLKYDWEPQAEESDLHLLTRLAREHDAVCKVAGGKVVFLARDEIEAGVALAITDYIECSVDDDDRAQHGKATAHHHDRGRAERLPETYGSDDGLEGPEAMLRHTLPNKERAQAAAKGAMSRLERMERRLTGTLTGDTDIMAGMVVTHDWGIEMYDGSWALKTVTHSMSKGPAYQTKIDSHKGKKGKGGKG